MNWNDDRLDARFDRLEGRFDRLQHTLLVVFGSLAVGILALTAAAQF